MVCLIGILEQEDVGVQVLVHLVVPLAGVQVHHVAPAPGIRPPQVHVDPAPVLLPGEHITFALRGGKDVSLAFRASSYWVPTSVSWASGIQYSSWDGRAIHYTCMIGHVWSCWATMACSRSTYWPGI